MLAELNLGVWKSLKFIRMHSKHKIIIAQKTFNDCENEESVMQMISLATPHFFMLGLHCLALLGSSSRTYVTKSGLIFYLG